MWQFFLIKEIWKKYGVDDMLKVFLTLTSDQRFYFRLEYEATLKLIISIYPLMGLQNAEY